MREYYTEFYIVANLIHTSLQYQKYFVINRRLFVTFIRLENIKRFVLVERNATQKEDYNTAETRGHRRNLHEMLTSVLFWVSCYDVTKASFRMSSFHNCYDKYYSDLN